MGRADEAVQIAEVIARISAIYPDISTGDIERVVQTVHTGFDDAKVREFIPPLPRRGIGLAHRGGTVRQRERRNPATHSTVQYRVLRLCRRAGVTTHPGALVHGLRHTFATDLANANANVSV